MAFGDRYPGHHDLTPQRLRPLSEALEREGVRTVVADYRIAYALSFETRERIIATPMYTVRYRPHQERVAAAGARTYVFFQGQPQVTDLLEEARVFGVGHRELTLGSFVGSCSTSRLPIRRLQTQASRRHRGSRGGSGSVVGVGSCAGMTPCAY